MRDIDRIKELRKEIKCLTKVINNLPDRDDIFKIGGDKSMTKDLKATHKEVGDEKA